MKAIEDEIGRVVRMYENLGMQTYLFKKALGKK
jgi:hypothetical protein